MWVSAGILANVSRASPESYHVLNLAMATEAVNRTDWDRCIACEVHAPTEQLVQHRRTLWCPTCAATAQIGSFRLRQVLTYVPFLVAVGVAYILGDSPEFGVGERLLILLAVWVVLTVVHELGHALAGKVAGYRIVGIVVGSGRGRLVRFTIFGVIVEVRSNFLSGGMTLPAGSGTFAQRVLFSAGGVIAELLVLIPVLFWDPTSPHLELARIGFIAFIAADVLTNLWPMKIEFPLVGSVPNDGLSLVNAFRNRDNYEELAMDEAEAAIWLLGETNSPGQQLRLVQHQFEDQPDAVAVREAYTNQLALNGEWRAAIDVGTPLLEADLAPESRALLLNNLAWSVLMLSDEEMLDQAEVWSKEAAELLPVSPAISSTRGSVLVLRGDFDEGMEHLLRAHRTCGHDPKNRALVSAFAALGADGQGDLELARDLYQAMLDEDPNCEARRVVETTLGLSKPD